MLELQMSSGGKDVFLLLCSQTMTCYSIVRLCARGQPSETTSGQARVSDTGSTVVSDLMMGTFLKKGEHKQKQRGAL